MEVVFPELLTCRTKVCSVARGRGAHSHETGLGHATHIEAVSTEYKALSWVPGNTRAPPARDRSVHTRV